MSKHKTINNKHMKDKSLKKLVKEKIIFNKLFLLIIWTQKGYTNLAMIKNDKGKNCSQIKAATPKY